MSSPDTELILSQFELAPGDGAHVFGSECVRVAAEIERSYRQSAYDHRPLLPNFELDSPFYLEQYRVGYACFKRAVATVLAPMTIVEIGIGVGIGGLAMMSGAPVDCHYHGIDSDEADFPTTPRVKPSEFVSAQMSRCGFHHEIQIANSQELGEIPEADLVHVDGDHSRGGARHDTALAWTSGARWILCDDARDATVCMGIFEALSIYLARGTVEWAYFNDTWTGSLLIRTDRK